MGESAPKKAGPGEFQVGQRVRVRMTWRKQDRRTVPARDGVILRLYPRFAVVEVGGRYREAFAYDALEEA